MYLLVPSDTPLACLECRTYLWAQILQLLDHTTLSPAGPSYAFLPNAVQPFPMLFGPLALHQPVPTVHFCRAWPDPALCWSTKQHMHWPVPPMHVFKDWPDPSLHFSKIQQCCWPVLPLHFCITWPDQVLHCSTIHCFNWPDPTLCLPTTQHLCWPVPSV